MRRVLVYVCLFLLMVGGLWTWITTISRSTLIQIFDKVLSALGFDTKYFKLAAIMNIGTAAGRLQWQSVMLMMVIFCVIVPLFLSGILLEVYSLIVANKDTKKYQQNEKMKNSDEGKRFVHIVDNVFGMLFAFIALIVTAVVPFSKISSRLGAAIVVLAVYVIAFVLQWACYKIIKKQIWNLRRVIRNRKAWR